MPIVIGQTCILFLPFVTVAHVGRSVGTEALAGLSLGNLTYNLLGLTLVMAPMTALETYASQAWGAKRKEEVGLHVQRALFVAVLLLKWFILLVLLTGVERAVKAGFGWDHVKEIDCVRGGPRRLFLLEWK